MRYLPMAALLLYPAWGQTELDVAQGKGIFRNNCAFCHGLTGSGGRGPSLISGRFLHGSTDEDVKNVIRNGVPGTTMPSFDFETAEIDHLVGYLRTLAGSAPKSAPVPGDPAQGRQVYLRNGCSSCHRIGMEGSVFGPELTRLGASRSPDYIRESLLNPSADILDDYQGVTVVARDGKRTGGVRINEDTFSVQLRDVSQNFRIFQKDEVREVIHETKSLMPAYNSLSQEDLQNLLAYLVSLRGDVNAGAHVNKPEGVR
ncbi:MAG: hypothetical protein DMG57_24905 [Acidobacteria bacterium]|nr:MAG: hypothetical protein DMG57_24905 [Acidobacteriota bacterium]